MSGPAEYTFEEGDWRKGLTGREIVAAVLGDPERTRKFMQWHQEWYPKLIFGSELSQHQKMQLGVLLFAQRRKKF